MFYYFITQKNEIVSGFIAIHVDDILWSGCKQLRTQNNYEIANKLP